VEGYLVSASVSVVANAVSGGVHRKSDLDVEMDFEIDLGMGAIAGLDIPRLAASFPEQANPLNLQGFLQSLRHIIEGQSGN
jgi:hypothetical protein